MKQQLNVAIVLAARMHDGQYDKSGLPYILHVMKVMHYLKTDDEELNCIAVLHDIVEDTAITINELNQMGFSNRIVDGVYLLTKRTGISYDEYLENICTSRDAMLVKKADLRHNMDIRRLKGITDKDMKRLEKYAKAYTKIEEKLNGI